MAHTNPLLVEAIAEQLLAELQVYEGLLEAARAARWSTDAALAVAAQGDRVQRYAENLPRMRVRMAEFLITRTLLSRRLVGSGRGRAEALAELHAEHLEAVHMLQAAAALVGHRS